MPKTPMTWAALLGIWLIALTAELMVLRRAGVFRARAAAGTGGLTGISFSLWQLLALIGIPLAAAALTWLWLRERGQ